LLKREVRHRGRGMSAKLHWETDKLFKLGDYSFTLDYGLGGSKRLSEDYNFTVMKTRGFFSHYEGLVDRGFKRILELGVYQGGSFAFLDQLLSPDRISAVELNTTPIPALDKYVAERADRARLYYGHSQDDVAFLEEIVAKDFGGELDLVVDDASHFYEQTRTAFKTLFPRLRPGGVYMIEDWSWSFESAFQDPSNAWYHIPSLTNLMVDLMEDMATGPLISDILVTRPMLTITRSAARSGTFLETHVRRGRETVLL